MRRASRNVGLFLLAILSISIGLYPIAYLFMDSSVGLLATKTQELLSNPSWYISFYLHISFGGLALISGWSQFLKRLRDKRRALHRKLGYIYIISVIISGLCGIYIGFNATGGIIASVGFISLGVIWLSSTLLAFKSIKQGDLIEHNRWMIYSYAACFAAVTLRLWLPILTATLGDFVSAYRIVAWLSWIPNILFAKFLASRIGMNSVK